MGGAGDADGGGGGLRRWAGRGALVTGANSGIGAAVTKRLLALGMTVAALDRQVDQLQILALGRVGAGGAGRLLRPLQCDLHREEEAVAALEWAQENLRAPPSLVVCCAAVAGERDVLEGDAGDWRRVLDVNVVAVATCAREAVRRMRAEGPMFREGLIVTVGGAPPPVGQAGWALHAASKAALKSLTASLRQELHALRLPIRVTLLSPGLTHSRLLLESAGAAAHARVFGGGTRALAPHHVAEALDAALGPPPHVQVEEIIITPLPYSVCAEHGSSSEREEDTSPSTAPQKLDANRSKVHNS